MFSPKKKKKWIPSYHAYSELAFCNLFFHSICFILAHLQHKTIEHVMFRDKTIKKTAKQIANLTISSFLIYIFQVIYEKRRLNNGTIRLLSKSPIQTL